MEFIVLDLNNSKDPQEVKPTPNGADPEEARPTPKTSIFADYDKIKLPVDDGPGSGVVTGLGTVPVTKPGKADWVMVHPTESTPVCGLFTDGDKTCYFVLPGVFPVVAQYALHVTFHKAVTAQRKAFIWPVPVVTTDNERAQKWYQSHRNAMEHAKTCWTQMYSDQQMGGYHYRKAPGDLGQPFWRPETLQEMLEIAFRDKIIADISHPINRKRE